MKRTIRLNHRQPTRQLAEAAVPFLPACGWHAKEQPDGWYLECRVDVHRSLRILALLQQVQPGERFELVTPQELPK